MVRHPNFKDISGNRYGRLLVVAPVLSDCSNALWRCVCDCGKEIITLGVRLRRGQAQSCGCSRSSGVGSRMNRIRKTEPGMTAKRHMLSTYRHSAKTKNMPFELDDEVFFSIVTSNCFYCGSSPRRMKRENSIHGSAKLNGIDRVNNELGYTIANSVPCCYICNHAKRDMLLSDFLTWLEQIYSHQKAKT